jgi:hypothetical protein
MKQLILFLSLSVFLAASESWFVGLEGGKSSQKYKNDCVAEDSTKGHFGVKVGKYVTRNDRFYGNVHYINEDCGDSAHAYGVAYDRVFDLGSKMHPYIGLSLTHVDNDDINSNHIMPNIGVSYRLEKFDLEAGYRHSVADFGTRDEGRVEPDGFNQAYFGANYRFKSLDHDEERMVEDYSDIYIESDRESTVGEVMYESETYEEPYTNQGNRVIVNSIDKRQAHSPYGAQF